MTFLPHSNRDVRPLSGELYPRYKVSAVCCVPGCSRFSDHAHHIWRRSFLAGDYAWVRLWNGLEVGNLAGLCWMHHEQVTLNLAMFAFSEQNNEFLWVVKSGNIMETYGAIFPQPPVRGRVTSDAAPDQEEHPEGPAHAATCPTCQQRIKPKRMKTEEARPRASWVVSVPRDERENGADVLDTLLEECRKVFGHDDDKKVRYFTVVQALALVVQNSDRMMGNE